MSISTPHTGGGSRRPSSKPAAAGSPNPGKGTKSSSAKSGTGSGEKGATEGKTGAGKGAEAKTSEAKTGAGKTSTRPPVARGGRRSSAEPGRPGGGKSGGKPPNRPVPPVKVSQGHNWAAITLFSVVGVVALLIVGFGIYAVYENSLSWKDKADGIPGIVDYRKTNPNLVKQGQHVYGHIDYAQSPPVGGKHNPNWQRCMGDIYTEQIPNENAVHALEHGSVWITYQPDLPKDQVDKLAAKVRGNDFMLMSPYPGLDKPISLQAWGFQLKVDKASDSRIDDFIKDLRINASMEPGAVCSSGNYTTKTGATPVDLGKDANPSGTMN